MAWHGGRALGVDALDGPQGPYHADDKQIARRGGAGPGSANALDDDMFYSAQKHGYS
jgi:hypothetical protein